MHTGEKFTRETNGYVCKCIMCASARKARLEREIKLDAEREASLEAGE
jgi:hypothetical protein